MRDNVKFEEYKLYDTGYEELVDFHALMYNDSNLRELLIYYDSNYFHFFKKVVAAENNDIYVLKMDDKPMGFVHLKKMESDLFLNNIFLHASIQGEGQGRRFLDYAMKKSNYRNFETFTLDVFESNLRALSWYRKMGMKEISRATWHEIEKKAISTNDERWIIKGKDDNGFEGLFYNEEKIATIVNSKNLILHNSKFKEAIIPAHYDKIITNDHLDSSCSRMVLETTLRMSISIEDLLN